MPRIFLLLLVLLAGTAGAAADTFTASGTWTAPAGVTSVTVEAWGGGGGGGAATGNPAKGGGGAGGQYAKKVVTVIPGNNYAVVVGAGGTVGAAAAGGAGGDSTFAATTVVAKGGAGGGLAAVADGTGALGAVAGGVGDVVFAGGNGSNGVGATGVGGAGGGGAGSTGAGGSAVGDTAGAGTTIGGGNGGAGLTARAGGNPGAVAGGGGGGGYATNPTDQSGGAGAAGMVIVSYVSAPAVTTAAATALTATGATLNGTVSSNGADTAVSFEYGLTAAYGSSIAATPSTVPGATTSATPVSAAVTGLACNTLYHFRAKGVSSVGTSYGNDLTFTTAACPLQVTVTPATGGSAIASNTAPGCGAAGTWRTLTGPNIAETAAGQIGLGNIVLSAPAGFEFNPAAVVTILLAGSNNRNNNINGASTGTSMATTVTASTITFTVTGVSAAANTLTWQNIQVRPTLSTPLASGNITHTGTSAITGVTGGVTNLGTLTEVASTPPCNTAPTAITNAATGITFDTATINGTVSSNGADTTVSFQWGLTTAYGETIPATPNLLLANAVNTPVSADLVGLNCNTLFHYRVVATNSAGTSYGADQTLITTTCIAPFPATACAATRYGEDLGCTSADVGLTSIALAPASITSCVSGSPVLLDLDLTVKFSSPNRYDVGIFIANDGKLPTVLPANGGSSSCSVDVLPTTPPFLDLDGVPQGTLDTCGDGNSSIDDSALPGGTLPLGDGVKRMTGVTLPCYASPDSGGKLFVPFVVTWDSQRSPLGFLCTSNLHPVPNTKSRCNAPASSVAVNVVVLPVIAKSDGISEINPGANTTYSVTITNDSGGTLQDVLFTDPAVSNPLTPLTVNSVSCASNGGAICPAMTSPQMITAMQGAGILIPSASLPSTQTTTSRLTFTINATLSGAATVGSHLVNTASVTVGGYTVSATDDDLIVIAPSVAKSFAPSTITEGAASLLTVTLTNPTGSTIAGVSFTDLYPAGMVNAATTNAATTCGGTVTAVGGGNSVALSGGTVPALGSCTVTLNVTSATAGSYTNSTGTVTHATGSIPAASATLTVNVAVFGAFNVCDVGTSCTNTTTATTSRIATKIAGSPFNLDIVALDTGGTRNTNYSNTVQVDLLDASNNGGALDSYNCRNTWTVIATLAPNPSFSPANNGLLTVGPFTAPEAWRDVRVRVTNVGGPARTGCSTDNFAIRPASIAISATDADWQTAGTVRVLNNADVLGAVVHKAGQPFTVTATALNAAAITTANYAGTPTLTAGDCTPAGTACTASVGNFALGVPGNFVSGVLASNVASYTEVGAFSLTLQDTDFASVDLQDTAASCAGYYVCSAATTVGRFVPDHFDTVVELTANLPMPCPAGLVCPYDGFVYSGQPFSVKVTAKNAGGNTTQNYQGVFAKAVALTAWDALGSIVTQNPPDPPGGSSLTNTAIAAAMFGAATPGVATTSTPVYTLATATTAPTDIYVRAVDTEGVTSLRNPTTTSVEGGVKVVSGRVKVGNAYGSELLPLPMTATVQYYNGTYWATSATDDVTSLSLAATYDVVKGATTGTTTPSPTGSATVSGGVLNILLGKPTAGAGNATIDPGVPSYLPLISGLATFGVYKGAQEFIYLREIY